MMLASWYVALGHDLPRELPADLLEHRDRLLFTRWLALTGRLSDWGPYRGELALATALALRPRRVVRRGRSPDRCPGGLPPRVEPPDASLGRPARARAGRPGAG